MLEKVKEFVNNAFDNKGTAHFERTVYWVKKLKPKASEALLIAAYTHDIERAFRKNEIHPLHKESDLGFLNSEFLKEHQEKGAKIISEFLRKNNASEELISKVKILVLNHELGGSEEQNLLKDCDSISFFETNAGKFSSEKALQVGKQKVKAKFDWMFNRISSKKAREIAKPLFEKALVDLEKA